MLFVVCHITHPNVPTRACGGGWYDEDNSISWSPRAVESVTANIHPVVDETTNSILLLPTKQRKGRVSNARRPKLKLDGTGKRPLVGDMTNVLIAAAPQAPLRLEFILPGG